MNRRHILTSTGVMQANQVVSQPAPAWEAGRLGNNARGHYALRNGPCKLEIAPGVVIDTVSYNGQVPGPYLRVREGIPVTIDVTNQTGSAEIVHWHGLANMLLHCHHALHMDFGFMQLIKYVG